MIPLGELNLGQGKRKCSVDSFSYPHLQIGEGQLNDLLNLCSLRSLWPTLRQVRYFIHIRLEELQISFFLGLVSSVRLFLKRVALRALIVGSIELYAS